MIQLLKNVGITHVLGSGGRLGRAPRPGRAALAGRPARRAQRVAAPLRAGPFLAAAARGRFGRAGHRPGPGADDQRAPGRGGHGRRGFPQRHVPRFAAGVARIPAGNCAGLCGLRCGSWMSGRCAGMTFQNSYIIKKIFDNLIKKSY